MPDTAPVTAAITKLIAAGVAEQTLLAAVAQLLPRPDAGRAAVSAIMVRVPLPAMCLSLRPVS